MNLLKEAVTDEPRPLESLSSSSSSSESLWLSPEGISHSVDVQYSYSVTPLVATEGGGFAFGRLICLEDSRDKSSSDFTIKAHIVHLGSEHGCVYVQEKNRKKKTQLGIVTS